MGRTWSLVQGWSNCYPGWINQRNLSDLLDQMSLLDQLSVQTKRGLLLQLHRWRASLVSLLPKDVVIIVMMVNTTHIHVHVLTRLEVHVYSLVHCTCTHTHILSIHTCTYISTSLSSSRLFLSAAWALSSAICISCVCT